ncbi:hypothetical protein TanjilG_03065 [Lupinus angustifolius]|uniref:H/ACA ribonucleoprotein complex non-core subunit NAF1 n=1 Tax=Lupinus angustifolius TaxID=3871 RepID=A0A4P1RCU7_LUPAN|nr:PREDICTED: H/ACA ribonucleoprotein complex non-core subunit NAF1-like [Lupinus angustifolius]OIW08389.1 hypothetical protein TanjilG_03065 [Lupinus angustifolius]
MATQNNNMNEIAHATHVESELNPNSIQDGKCQGNGNKDEIETENEDSISEQSSSSSDSEERDEDEDEDDESVSDDGGDAEKMLTWGLVDDADGERGGEPTRSKNELQNLPPVPPVEVTLEPHHHVQPVGVIMSILSAQVIVEGVEKHEPLNEGSILWVTESQKPLGLIDDIFGPVKKPYYIVRYNSENEVPEGIGAGTLISFVPEFADYVLNNKDVNKKGYDASGANDEELSDEYEFSDDEKEAEYRRVQRATRRDKTDQNQGKRKIIRKKGPLNQNVVPSIPDAPAPPLLDHGISSPFSGNRQGNFGGTTMPIPFPIPPSNAGPNLFSNGIWTNGATVPQQPQPSPPPNAFPSDGMPWYPQNTQIPHQLPMLQFQQLLHPSQGPLSPVMFPGVLPNIFAQPMYAQGLVGPNQMPFGMNTPFGQIQSPIFAAQQGFPSGELQSQGNLNLHSNTIPSAPPQLRPSTSAGRSSHGRTFHAAGRKGSRPAR